MLCKKVRQRGKVPSEGWQLELTLCTAFILHACIVQLPLADGFLENRSIRTKKSLLYSWQIMLALQSWGESCLHRRKRSETWGFPPFYLSKTAIDTLEILYKDELLTFYPRNAGVHDVNWVEYGIVSVKNNWGGLEKAVRTKSEIIQDDRSQNDLCLRGTKGSWREPLWSKLSSNPNGNPRISESHNRPWLFCDESINVNSTCFHTGADEWACCARLVINRISTNTDCLTLIVFVIRKSCSSAVFKLQASSQR